MNVDEWLDAYGESHQNVTNKRIHWICVPVITVTLVAFLSLLKIDGTSLHGGHVFLTFTLLFYARLSVPLALGMLPVAALVLMSVWGLGQLSLGLAPVSAILFVAAWILQFIGHKIEGKKPSFFQDLQFLLIGPLWLLAHVYERFHIRYSPAQSEK